MNRVFRRPGVTESFVKPPKKLYGFHVANLRAISDGLDHVFRSARNAIAHDNPKIVDTHVRLLSFLLGTWSEVRLLKLLYEPNVFSPAERSRILRATALDRWSSLVATAFRKHYGIPRALLRPPKLPSTAHLRFELLKQTLRSELRTVISMRNKLAHGQWNYPLNEALNDIAQEEMDALRTETVLTLIQKMELLNIFCQVIHDLSVSRSTFERDWDIHFQRFEQIRTNIARKSYDKWEAQIRARYTRGRRKLLATLGK